MVTDSITEFIDIKNFDAGLIINPDSVYIKNHSSRIFQTYITSAIGIKMLSGKPYFAKAMSPITDKNILTIGANDEHIILYPANNYPLFSFDATVTFKNAEVIEYYRAVCSTTETDEEYITTSSNFSTYDIRYILINDTNFLTALSNLGYDGPFTLPTNCLSISASELLNLVARREWKFRTRLNNNTYYAQVFNGNDFYASANHTVSLVSGVYDIPELSNWISETITVC